MTATVKAKEVLPPHPVRSRAKVLSMARDYREGVAMPAIVIVMKDGEAWGITGSHRTAALQTVRPEEEVKDGEYFRTLDGDELLRRAQELGDWNMLRLLDLLFDGMLGEEEGGYHALVDAAGDYVDDDDVQMQEALLGQGDKR